MPCQESVLLKEIHAYCVYVHTVSHAVHIAEQSSTKTQQQLVGASGLQNGTRTPRLPYLWAVFNQC